MTSEPVPCANCGAPVTAAPEGGCITGEPLTFSRPPSHLNEAGPGGTILIGVRKFGSFLESRRLVLVASEGGFPTNGGIYRAVPDQHRGVRQRELPGAI